MEIASPTDNKFILKIKTYLLCSAFRVPCSVFNVPRSVFNVPCSVFNIPRSVFCVLRSLLIYYYSLFFILCTLIFALCSLIFALCSLFLALGSLFFSLCSWLYRTFNTCSLICSRSSFISTTIFCISLLFDFEPRVFTSLPISWAMNPSFLPGDFSC